MRVSLYGREFSSQNADTIKRLVHSLSTKMESVSVQSEFHDFLKNSFQVSKDLSVFKGNSDIGETDCLISIGGDGTMLDTVKLVGDSGIPILGINSGRLGFLSNVALQDFETSLDRLVRKEYNIDSRSLIQVSNEIDGLNEFSCALNEITLHKKDTSSMIKVHTHVNDVFTNTYWADGLIVATPTGSTAYSLSCGGPIVAPNSETFVLTPIAPHNLNVRPMVIPDGDTIRLMAESREPNVLLTLDSQSISISTGTEILLRKAPYKVNLVSFEDQDFFGTIRNKLMWGIDRRN